MFYKSHFFTVLLSYCTGQDIPHEARDFKMLQVTEDLVKMLWYMHNVVQSFLLSVQYAFL